MLKVVAVAAVVLLAAILLVAAARPDAFRVERAVSINAPPEKIFPLINDFHRWGLWSPYEKKDPAMTRTFGAPTSGKGAAYAWDGNGEIGQGRMEITESAAPSKVAIRLDFVRPFEAHNRVEFTLEPRGDATAVTWRMQGRMPYLAKVFGLFCDMDGMIGRDFDAGLASLKTVAER